MNRQILKQLKLVTFFLFGLSMIAVAGFFYLTSSAEMHSDSNVSDHNFLLGKLAYSETCCNFPFAFVSIKTLTRAISSLQSISGGMYQSDRFVAVRAPLFRFSCG